MTSLANHKSNDFVKLLRRVWRWISGVGAEAIFEQQSEGFFLGLEGSYEALFLGTEQPKFKVGDQIKITLEKVEQ